MSKEEFITTIESTKTLYSRLMTDVYPEFVQLIDELDKGLKEKKSSSYFLDFVEMMKFQVRQIRFARYLEEQNSNDGDKDVETEIETVDEIATNLMANWMLVQEGKFWSEVKVNQLFNSILEVVGQRRVKLVVHLFDYLVDKAVEQFKNEEKEKKLNIKWIEVKRRK